MGGPDSLGVGLTVDGAVDGQFRGSERGGAVILEQAGLNEVILFQIVQSGAATGDDEAVAHSDAEVATGAGDKAARKKVPADDLKLGKYHGRFRRSLPVLTPAFQVSSIYTLLENINQIGQGYHSAPRIGYEAGFDADPGGMGSILPSRVLKNKGSGDYL